MGSSKWVHLLFVAAGLLLMFLVAQAIDWVWGYFARPNDVIVSLAAIVIAGLLTFMAWKNKDVFDRSSEIVGELAKVTWPTRAETKAATIVVIITTVVASLLLGLFDLIWSWATGVIYT